LDLEFLLNVVDAVMIFSIAFLTVYLVTKIGQRKLRLLTLLLAGFLILHALYHLTAALGGIQGLEFLGTLSDVIVEPVGWLVFLAFAVYFARNS
jgi:hypothetical protein